jgi:anaerobic ribonucleoside-triphosphate reductase activating protein
MIRTDDMLNGNGLRVVLFCTACDHCCTNCHNPETWESSNGMAFDNKAKENLFKELKCDYIRGLTISGGDPLHEKNLQDILYLCKEVREKFPDKTIWIYSGYTWDEIFKNTYNSKRLVQNLEEQNELYRQMIVTQCDVFVDGKFIEELSDVNYHWAGSSNQRVIDVQESLKQNKVVLYCD